MTNFRCMALAALTTAAAAVLSPAAAADFDHAPFDRALKAYVDAQGLVDYNGFAADRGFADYMRALAAADEGRLSPDGRLAFWINAYNAVTIDKVIRWKPKRSVRESFLPGVWTSTRFFTTREHVVAGRTLSQDDIEHEILRGQFRDPRIHFAIVCASKGCPKLPQAAYTAANVQAMLDAETRKYLNSERGLRVDDGQNTVYLSKLFDWFAADFEAQAGSVLDYVKPWVDEKTRAFLDGGPRVRFLDYDWSLNAKGPIG